MDDVAVDVLDAVGDVLPGLAAVVASHEAAMLDGHVNSARVVRLDVHRLYVPLIRILGEPPLVASSVGLAAKRTELLPAIPAILRAEERHRLHARVDRLWVRWVDVE